jgi:LPXTG-site transpeptidase (sortase) family protein
VGDAPERLPEQLYERAVQARDQADWPRVVVLCGQLLEVHRGHPGAIALLRQARDELRRRRSPAPEDPPEAAPRASARAAHLRASARLPGTALMVAGLAVLAVTALAITGVVPLWRPAVPAPIFLDAGREAGGRAASASEGLNESGSAVAPLLTRVGADDDARPPRWWESDLEPGETLDVAGRELTTPGMSIALPGRRTAPAQPIIRLSLPPPPPPPAPGLPVHLAIPSIRVDTRVVPLDRTIGADGGLEWETAPFVAGYYPITGLAGANANVVLSGHVTSQDRGNVFRDLYRLQPGEPIVVYTDAGQFRYRVVELRVVTPRDVDGLAQTTEPRLTLITCAGTFDFRTRSFSERLLVMGELMT